VNDDAATPPDRESTQVRVRALACALLHVLLLAIYPVAKLAARAARARTARRHGAMPVQGRPWGGGSRAELVFAAIERGVVETRDQLGTHHYVYEWDIGPSSELVTPGRAMTILKAAPDLIFPFGVSGGTRIEVDQVLDLDDVRWPRDDGNPVVVSQADSTSFTFVTLPGHFRGPGRTIRFAVLERGGRLILRQVGATSPRMSDLAYDGGAWFSWQTQAATLRAALSEGHAAS
jgi:hypothetical protein